MLAANELKKVLISICGDSELEVLFSLDSNIRLEKILSYIDSKSTIHYDLQKIRGKRSKKKMLYLISLFYNLVYHRWFHKSFWWSRIDDGIYLGAIPLDYHLEALLSLEISTVISMVEDFERLSNFLANPISKVLWREYSVENISISAVDFKPLTLGQIYLALGLSIMLG